MKPGYELDALVAQEVVGWRILSHWEPGVVKHLLDENQCEVDPPQFPPYSTDIAAAWKVAEKVGFREDWTVKLETQVDSKCLADRYVQVTISYRGFDTLDVWTATGETAAHAICLAALKTVNK